MYLKQENDKVIFPYTRKNLEVENPNISFPNTISDSLFLQYGVHPVTLVENNLASNEIDGVLGQPYMINGRWEVKPIIITQSKDEYELRKKQMYIDSVQAYITAKCVELGYDNENSIAKYLVPTNKYYIECSSLSVWIGDVWDYANQISIDIMNGLRTEPTIEELIAELPELVVV